jgi:hypothetical protein
MLALLRRVLRIHSVPKLVNGSLFWLVRVWHETELSRESRLLLPLLLLQLTQRDAEFVSLSAEIGPIGLGQLFGSFIRIICHLAHSTPHVRTPNYKGDGLFN